MGSLTHQIRVELDLQSLVGRWEACQADQWAEVLVVESAVVAELAAAAAD